MQILFCGDVLPSSRSLLKERLPAGEDEIAIRDGTNLRQALAKADVVIPMMRILDETLMEAGSFGLVSNGARGSSVWTSTRPARVASGWPTCRSCRASCALFPVYSKLPVAP